MLYSILKAVTHAKLLNLSIYIPLDFSKAVSVEKGACEKFVILSNRSIVCHALSIEEEGVRSSLKSFLLIAIFGLVSSKAL